MSDQYAGLIDRPLSRRSRRFGGFLKRRSATVIAVLIVATVVFLAFFAPMLGFRDPSSQNLEIALRAPGFSGPDGTYLLGTDALGRDVLARTANGARPLMTIVLIAVTISAVLGFIYGLLAGLSRGVLGQIAMRIADVQLSIPPVVLAIVFAAALDPGVKSVVIAIALVTWPEYARLTRAEVLRLRTTEFVLLARAAGLKRFEILRRHIVPNVLNSFIVLVTLQTSTAIIFASALSFLGVGVQEPQADWGNMLATGTQYIQTSWWLVVVPGVAITLVVLSVSIIGDRLRDLLDPRSRTR